MLTGGAGMVSEVLRSIWEKMREEFNQIFAKEKLYWEHYKEWDSVTV